MKPAEILVDVHVVDNPEVVSITDSLNINPVIIENHRDVFNYIGSFDDPIRKAKDVLFLTQNKGPFIKQCPGTRSYICCGYNILNIGTFCTMDCVYCILQSYFHPPLLQYFANQDKMMNELDFFFNKENAYRIGTGEYTDSMIWDYWTDLSKNLVKKFSSQSNALLELKTKSSNIEKLKGLDHHKKTVVAWSLNTEFVIENEENDTASLQSRLEAATKCELWGYPIAFHFDPIIMYDGCEKDYENVVESIFSNVSSKNIIWISLGAFRFMPPLKPIIQKRFPHSKIIYGEFVQGVDNKMRYFKPLRVGLYQRIIKKIKEISPEVLIYFCMEDDEVWHKTLGFTPSERGGLSKMLDKNAIRFCGLDSHG